MSIQAFYPLLTLISIALFAWLGRRMANNRHRNGIMWGVGGALLPPALLVLLLLKPLDAEPDDDSGELSEG